MFEVWQGSLEGPWYFEGKFLPHFCSCISSCSCAKNMGYCKTLWKKWASTLYVCRWLCLKSRNCVISSYLCLVSFLISIHTNNVTCYADCIFSRTGKSLKREYVFCKRACWFQSIWGHKEGIFAIKTFDSHHLLKVLLSSKSHKATGKVNMTNCKSCSIIQYANS